MAETFAKACARGGLNVFANIEYHSNIKGEHSYYRVRASDREIHSHVDWIDVLVSLDKETIFGDLHRESPTHAGHRNEVSPGGAIIYDASLKLNPQDIGRPDVNLYPIPYLGVLIGALKESGHDKELSRYQVMQNTVAFGASMALIDYDFTHVSAAIKEGFTGRKVSLGDLNVKAAQHGYDYVKNNFKDSFSYKLHPKKLQKDKRIVIRGIQAVGIAKFRAGCAFQTYYPITPATDESEYLEHHEKEYNMVVVQTEDEISAILMATGAAHAGVRSSTSTSGPGFCLMAEGLGWASHTEAPGPVILLYQRGGPSTGLPTRTEQGDLQFVLHAGHGDFPRIAIAPGDPAECFYDTFDAFNYAEKFQMPVVVIVDKFLASSYRTMAPPQSVDLKVDRGQIATESQLGAEGLYKRYALTPTGISPRSMPGTRGGIFHTTGDEHDEFGHITENSELRIKMMQKRMRKLQLAAESIPEEKKVNIIGPPKADLTIIGWGSTKGAIIDGMQDLEADGIRCNFLQVRYMSPFPTETVTKYLSNATRKILVENNYSGQLGALIREHTGITVAHRVLKYNGRPFSQNEIFEGIKEVIKNGTKEVVMAHA